MNETAAIAYAHLRREEKGGLGRMMGAGPARKTLDLLAIDRWDLLAPMLAVVTQPEKRLRAAAHVARLVTKSPIRIGTVLYQTALHALEDYQALATPLQELTVIETCVDIVKRNDVLAGEPVSQAIFTHLDSRLQMPRTSEAAKLAMRPRVRHEMKALFAEYLAGRDKDLSVCDGLQKVLHGLSGELMAKAPPTRPSVTNIISLPVRKPA